MAETRTDKPQLSAVERRVLRSLDGEDRRGRRSPTEELHRERTVEDYLRGAVMPRWMERLRDIERGIRRHRPRLAADHEWLREQHADDPERFAAAWRALVARAALRRRQRPRPRPQRVVPGRAPAADGPAHRRVRADRRPALSARGADGGVGASEFPAAPARLRLTHRARLRRPRREAGEDARQQSRPRPRSCAPGTVRAPPPRARPRRPRQPPRRRREVRLDRARVGLRSLRRCTSPRASSASMWRETRDRLSPVSAASADSRGQRVARRGQRGRAAPACSARARAAASSSASSAARQLLVRLEQPDPGVGLAARPAGSRSVSPSQRDRRRDVRGVDVVGGVGLVVLDVERRRPRADRARAAGEARRPSPGRGGRGR